MAETHIKCMIFCLLITLTFGFDQLDDSSCRFSKRPGYKHNCTRLSAVDFCFICKDPVFKNTAQQTVNMTVCYTKKDEGNATQPPTTVSSILKGLPENTTHLHIYLDNTWHGYLPMQAFPIDLTPIARLKRLIGFKLSQKSEKFIQLFPLHFTSQTFSAMTNLRELIIDLPLTDQSLKNLVAPLKSLKVLFLQPRGISMKNMSETISSLHPNTENTLEELHISTFQLMGMDGYNSTLNLTDFLSNRTFPHIRTLFLKGNSLARLHTGLPKHFPMVETVDISYNLLLDTINIVTFFEIVTHKSCVHVNLQYQGYVGGGVLSSDKQFPPYQTGSKDSEESNGLLSKSDFSMSDKLFLPSGRNYESTEESDGFFYNTTHLYMNFIFIVQCLNRQSLQNGAPNASAVLTSALLTRKVIACIFSVPPDHLLVNSLPPYRDIFNPNCMLYTEFPIGPNVTVFKINDLHWERSTVKGFEMAGKLCIKTPNQLRAVNIAQNKAWMPMSKLNQTLKHLTSIQGLDHIEELGISNNFLEINASIVFKEGNFPNLQELYMGNNSLLLDDTYNFCAHSIHIRHLNLEGTNLGQTAPMKHFIRNCNNLENLIISQNSLSQKSLENIDLTGTDKLKFIDLSNNKIEFLPQNFRNQIDRQIQAHTLNLTIDLTGNPLSCDCRNDSLSFLSWIISVKHFISLKNLNTLTCGGKTGIRGIATLDEKVINHWKSECFTSPWHVIVIAVLSTIVGICLGIGALCCYKKRYILGYKMFKCNQSLVSCCKQDTNDQTIFQYDAFISYCADDRFWVHSFLMKTLEETYGFKLCIHYRDFPVGGSIIDTIVKKMNNSQRLIVVLSDISLKSEWCQFELIQAMNQANRLHKTIIAIQMGELKMIDQNPTAGHILQTHVCLHWNEQSSKASVFFWKKLVSCLYGEKEGVCAVCCGFGATSIKYDQIYDMDDD